MKVETLTSKKAFGSTTLETALGREAITLRITHPRLEPLTISLRPMGIGEVLDVQDMQAAAVASRDAGDNLSAIRGMLDLVVRLVVDRSERGVSEATVREFLRAAELASLQSLVSAITTGRVDAPKAMPVAIGE